jgi:ACS family glucarate transporter-like MFS transporter
MSVSQATRLGDQGNPRIGKVRYGILAMLFAITVVNYADRATLALAGPSMLRQFGLSPVSLGIVFSAFAWTYMLAQIPGGWLLDRYGSKMVYFFSIFAWSIFTLLQGGVHLLAATVVVPVLFVLRALVGLAEAPSFPANSRIVAAWFPTAERGTASAIFNSAQYLATALFAPIMGTIVTLLGWPWVFYLMGGLGLVLGLLWLVTVYEPENDPRLGAAELAHIRGGGGLADPVAATQSNPTPSRDQVLQLLGNRMFIGICIGQYCISVLTYFFLTWFPVYLVQQRGMSILSAGFVASIPALCGFAGGILGGLASDRLFRFGLSLTAARKIPIVAGLLMSTAMIACNYVDTQWLIVAIMAVAFLGKGIGALGWAVVSDIAPRPLIGLCGGIFNMFGNVAGITTPIIIGLLVQGSGAFDGALIFVGANAVVAVLSYVLIVGEIRRLSV